MNQQMQHNIETINDDIDEVSQSHIYDEAMDKAQKYLRKNKKEWKRLQQHAFAALENNNKAQYVYAIKKMRDMLRQPYNDQLIETMWHTTQASIKQIIEQQTA